MREKIESDGDDMGTIPSLPRADLVGMRQFAVQALGESSNLSVRSDEFAICAFQDDFRPGGPQSGDLVVLEKRRDGLLKRRWIARLHLIEGRWEAHYESSDLRWQNEPPVRFDKDIKIDETDNCETEIIGVVMSAIRHLYQPLIQPPAPLPEKPKTRGTKFTALFGLPARVLAAMHDQVVAFEVAEAK